MPTFSKFEGDRTKYRKWKMEILAAARLASTDEYGLMPFALSAAQIAALPNPAGPGQGPYVFAPAANPGPPQPGAAAAMQAWKILDDRYTTQRSALNLLTSEVVMSLGDGPLDIISEPQWGTQRRNLADIFAIMDPIYDVATTSDLDALKAQLKEPQDGSLSMRDFCAKHRTIITACADANQPIPMMDQIKALRVAVERIPQCQSATMHWMLVVPLLANQTFEGLATALCQAAENLGEPTTASMAGYANAAYQIPPTPPDTSHWTAMAALMTDHMAQTQNTLHALAAALTSGGGHNKPARSNPKAASAHAPARHKGRRHDQYCWTHGECAHESAECQNPAQGHQVTATRAKRMGGR
jgi:hypothetical protein